MDNLTALNHPSADSVLLAPLYKKFESKHGKRKAETLTLFARRFFASSSHTEVARLPLSQIHDEVLHAWQFVQTRRDDEPRIQFSQPRSDRHGLTEHGTIIHILLNDMPFLVDSISQELTGRGIAINAVYNAVFHVHRDDSGDLIKLAQTRTDDNITEALLCFHTGWMSQDEIDSLQVSLRDILKHVRLAVQDYAPMAKLALKIREKLQSEPVPVSDEELKESCEFIDWLVDNHFTFLGYERYSITDTPQGKLLTLDTGSLLGISQLKTSLKRRVLLDDVIEGAGALIMQKQICSFAKSSNRSKIHRPGYYDYVLIKEFDAAGEVRVEHRFLGLYTSTVYFQRAAEIPLVRKKVKWVLDHSGFSPNGHSIKGLNQVINVLPRDELFQITTEQLFSTAMQINQIHERRQVRLFVRRDAYGNFFSCLVYVPKDIYNTKVRLTITRFLMTELQAQELDFSAYYSESILARLHFTVRVANISKVNFDPLDLEARLVALVKPWEDQLWECLQAGYSDQVTRQLYSDFAPYFSLAYKEDYQAAEAVLDIPHLQKVVGNGGISLEFEARRSGENFLFGFKVFQFGKPLVLSDVIPMLENMGFRVLSERDFRLQNEGRGDIWLHDFGMSNNAVQQLDMATAKEIFESAFDAVWNGRAEHDAFNTLVLGSQLPWREVALLRAYAAYMRQIQSSYSQPFIAEALREHGRIAALLVRYFFMLFDPSIQDKDAARRRKITRLEKNILAAIDSVTNLAQDTVLRLYLKLMQATQRTNYFQTGADGTFKDYFSFKLMPQLVDEIPRPRPKYEIFVYSPSFEGVHLRGGKVARGGLRWSDRREDFRTEVLGLVKAQQVKNSVIVPVGAKGGFVVKSATAGLSREELLAQGVNCYKCFIRGLLDITDNIVAGAVVPPPKVVRRDEDDTYLVVAADKGTAAFSDHANSVAKEYGFWLGDGFASGGSNGYDHKKMGITARGAWISVQRHFRELGINIQKDSITVLGIGDMSGDVFGNGMLLSRKIKLVGAFNHLHVFIDPDPDPESSFRERQRLFKLSRSSWTDYDAKLISRGGGIFSRSAKSIPVSPEMKKRFGIEVDNLAPDKLINALLKSPVDLLWNGGIGTYVKSSEQSHQDIGDKANDSLRVNGSELRCKVVGEGGNLGLTQAARIEFALSGGVSLTDFIDNSAGVDCSDHEVNIKILLNEMSASGSLAEDQRSKLLKDMTAQVAGLVLQNNYSQVQAIGLARSQMQRRTAEYVELVKYLETHAGLDRAIEHMPGDEELIERQSRGDGMTRPELAIVTSYIKMFLKAQLVKSGFIDDPYLEPYLFKAFPQRLVDDHADQIRQHRLRREIIATQLANTVINLAGPSFIYRKVEYTGATPDEVVKAAVVAKDIFSIDDTWHAIEALDYKVDAALQNQMMAKVMGLLRRVTRWLLRNRRADLDMAGSVREFAPAIASAISLLPDRLPENARERWRSAYNRYTAQHVPKALAHNLACIEYIFPVLAILEISKAANVSHAVALETFFAVGDCLQLTAFRQLIIDLKVDNQWQALARKSFQDDLDWQQRALTVNVIRSGGRMTDITRAVCQWADANSAQIARSQAMLKNLQREGSSDYAMYSVVLRELLNLAQGTARYN